MIHPTGSRLGAVLGTLFVLFGTLPVSESMGGSISKSPANRINKAKIQMLQSYAPARNSSEVGPGSLAVPNPDDDSCEIGDNVGGRCKVHPLITTYMEMQKDVNNGEELAFDVLAAVSLDEGKTWKRINLSNFAHRFSEYHGPPCFSKDHGDDGDDNHNSRFLHEEGDGEDTTFAAYPNSFKPMNVVKGNKVLVAWVSQLCQGGVPDGEQEGPQLPESDPDDKYMVAGRQNCRDYDGEVEGLGNTLFHCVWAARGIVSDEGDITWTKPERLTSGRRDAYQLFAAVAPNMVNGKPNAWSLVWQEDPKGLEPGEQAGPGDGMSGAKVNHKTDIWYSYLVGATFDSVTKDDDSERPTVNTQFSDPVRVTDNGACKILREEGTFTVKGGRYCEYICGDGDNTLVEASGGGGLNISESCISDEGIPLNGDTGASRAVMVILPGSSSSSQVLLVYEESKGLGFGGENADGHETTRRLSEGNATKEDTGRNVFYHTFPYDKPDEVRYGTMINLPELDENGEPLLSLDGQNFLTRNARRPRIITQSMNKVGSGGTAAVLLYREGEKEHGAPAHVMMRRLIDGYAPSAMECKQFRYHPVTGANVCVKGGEDLNADQQPFEDGALTDARAHRGFIKGDFLVLAYTFTDKWGRGDGQPYDLYIKRSFNGGRSWTDFRGKKENATNVSNVRHGSGGWSIMEPRLVKTSGTIGSTPKSMSDVENGMVFYVSYCTTHKNLNNPDRLLQSMPEHKDIPKDIHWTYTSNFGETYMKVWNDSAQKWQYPFLAKTHGDAGVNQQFGAPQMKVTPAGNKMFASYEGNVLGTVTVGGGGPCRANSAGSAVCSNGTTGVKPFEMYDFNGDGVLDKNDRNLLVRAADPPHNSLLATDVNLEFDLNGDGAIDGGDFQLFDRAVLWNGEVEQWFPSGSHNGHLRGRQ